MRLQKHQKKSSLVSDSHGTLLVSRLAFLSGGLLSLDSRMESYHEIETDNGPASHSVPGSVSLSSSPPILHLQASRHHESPAMNWILARNILESVAESRIVFHIRIVRRPPPPYFRQDYLSHRVL